MYVLRLGCAGQSVKEMQRNLNALGFPVTVDGDFGPATERMLKQFQTDAGIKLDGIFGTQSMEALFRMLPIAG